MPIASTQARAKSKLLRRKELFLLSPGLGTLLSGIDRVSGERRKGFRRRKKFPRRYHRGYLSPR